MTDPLRIHAILPPDITELTRQDDEDDYTYPIRVRFHRDLTDFEKKVCKELGYETDDMNLRDQLYPVTTLLIKDASLDHPEIHEEIKNELETINAEVAERRSAHDKVVARTTEVSAQLTDGLTPTD